MSGRIAKVVAVTALLALPALAYGTTYEGNGKPDHAAKITLKVRNVSGKRYVTKIVADNLRFRSGKHHCTESGRTPKETLKGQFRIRKSGRFRAIGGTTTADLLAGGELDVRGQIDGAKATGTVLFTFGKTGCRTGKSNWKAGS